MAQEFLDVDPRVLRLPQSRITGADPAKLAAHLARFGNSVLGMPPLEVTRGANGELMINSGVTRATRVAQLRSVDLIRVEVIDNRPKWNMSRLPRIGDLV